MEFAFHVCHHQGRPPLPTTADLFFVETEQQIPHATNRRSP
jgi:hypothetical protein